MADLIRPQTVEYNDMVIMTYQSPRYIDSGDEQPYRYFTVQELEDVLLHARVHDAEDDTLVDINSWGRRCVLKIVLPKHWSDISTPPVGRYAPAVNRFWRGFVGGSICMILLSLLILGLVFG